METKSNDSEEFYCKRPRTWEQIYKWHLGQVPDDDPSKKSAIFVVHGMGEQAWAETSATLRAGIEDALESDDVINKTSEILPAPFIQDGFWANYDDIEKSFPEEWKRLEETKYNFFTELWKSRSISSGRTFWWVMLQLLRLVFDFSVVKNESFRAWLIYVIMLFMVTPLVFLIFVFKRSIMSRIFNDVRLYCSPRGMIEKAIVQRIDCRVGVSFLRLIGLDWDFRKLKMDYFEVDGKPVTFDRVFFVAHSLGTVISYNVISDLFARADELAIEGDDEQKEGVKKFWGSLQRFITLGSPLDKIAVLFGCKVLRKWPDRMFNPEKDENKKLNDSLNHFLPNWWINFYHYLDPVSGALSHEYICPQNQMPNNQHLNKFFYVPGLAHVKYWKDNTVLGYVLSRFFGKDRLEFLREKSMSARTLTWFALAGYLIWLIALLSPLALILWFAGVV